MPVSSTVVAVGLGILVGWGLAGYERRPALVGLTVGLLTGTLMLAFAVGPEPIRGGASLVVGCGVGLVVLFVPRHG